LSADLRITFRPRTGAVEPAFDTQGAAMTTYPAPRQYVAVRPSKALHSIYQSRELDALRDATLRALDAPLSLREAKSFNAVSAPSLDWTLEVEGVHGTVPKPSELVISYEFQEHALIEPFRKLIRDSLNKDRVGPDEDAFLAIGADPGGGLTDHWCPGAGNLASFGTRADARRVLNVDTLHAHLPHGTSPRVNVVIIDQGLNKEAILARHPHSWGGGWRYHDKYHNIAPGTAERTSHGAMIARNVLDIAPDAVVYDMPLIPRPAITNIPVFASNADGAYHVLLQCISCLRQHPQWSGPWVLVNAWAIFDRASESPLGDYTEDNNSTDPQSIGHRLNKVIKGAALNDHIDVVFAAGNCGEFCSSPRCGRTDRGPGHSIWGANSSSAVITVGAVLTNEMWLGYSSQGRGQPLLGEEKPDFCAPSLFRETTDAHVHNTGTSAACGLTAGVVAALREKWDANSVSPQDLRQVLIDTARKTQGPQWNERIGYGVLDAWAAFKKLAPPQISNTARQTSAIAPQPSWLSKIRSRLATLRRSILRS